MDGLKVVIVVVAAAVVIASSAAFEARPLDSSCSFVAPMATTLGCSRVATFCRISTSLPDVESLVRSLVELKCLVWVGLSLRGRHLVLSEAS